MIRRLVNLVIDTLNTVSVTNWQDTMTHTVSLPVSNLPEESRS